MIRSLASGIMTGTVGNGQYNGEQLLYSVPNNSQTIIKLMSFVNISSVPVTLTVYKNIATVDYVISPYNMVFPAQYMAQENGEITLSGSDQIKAFCNISGAVQFTINGEEIPLTSKNT